MSSVPSGVDVLSHTSSSSSLFLTDTIHSIAPSPVSEMKDVSNSSRVTRPSAYPKKKPSPYGVSKSSRRQSPLYPPHSVVKKTPRAAKAELLAQRQRYAQINALRREGIYLEEEYHDEIRVYMHDMERSTMCSISSMDQQPEIRWHMRPCLVDFLVELHFMYRLRPETLYLTLNIIDRYVSKRVVYVKHYQLVGCAALWIAAKFEDAKERVPSVHDLAQMCQETYDESAFIQMEGHVLSTIQWTLGHPTAESWLRILCCGPVIEEQKVQHVARFLMEITLFYREFVQYPSSAIALGALSLARYLCGKGHRIFEETEECLEIIDHLDNRLAKHANELSETLVKKYSYAFYSKAATFVLQFYLQGGRFQRQPLVSLPMTPVRTYSSKVCTPMSVSTTASDFSDDMDMPATPTSPILSSDAFSGSYLSDDKENLPSPKFEPVVNKQLIEQVPEQFLPHDYVVYQRQALQNLNMASPRPAMVS